MRKKINFEFSMSGFVIALILVAMFASMFGLFISGLDDTYGTDVNVTFAKYNQTDAIVADLENIQNKTAITQEQGVLDVIGGYFSSGYAALKVTVNSFTLFDTMLEQGAEDVTPLAFFKPFIYAIILAAILIGIILTVLLKMRL